VPGTHGLCHLILPILPGEAWAPFSKEEARSLLAGKVVGVVSYLVLSSFKAEAPFTST
jgi:hypothetical protein